MASSSEAEHVFDRDVLNQKKPKDFEKLYNTAKKAGILFAESFPCFEVWFLLHYIVPSKYYPTANSVEAELCRYLQGYCKDGQWLRRSNIYETLKQFQQQAIAAAKKISTSTQATLDSSSTFSDVYILVESILTETSCG